MEFGDQTRKLVGLAWVAGISVVISSPAADVNPIGAVDYKTPEYTAAQLPPIVSCDAGAGDSGSSASGTGGLPNNALDTAKGIYDAVKKSKSDDKSDDEDKSAGYGMKDAGSCKALGSIETSAAEKMACDKIGADGFMDDLRAGVYCRQGVLSAIAGELSCFAKQIQGAQDYMNGMIASKGGLSDMLSQGVTEMQQIDDEISDREAQLKQVTEKLGDEKSGLKGQEAALTALYNDVPAKEAALAGEIRDIKETLVEQKMAKTMECLNTPRPGLTCVKDGTNAGSSKYKAGDVSPLDYYKCIYAQARYRASGKKASVESASITEFDSLIKGLSVATAESAPKFDKSGTVSGTIGSYRINSASDLVSALDAFAKKASRASGKNFSLQIANDVQACSKQSELDVARSANNAQDARRGYYASQMRSMAGIYQAALKAATGNGGIQINTSACEAASLDDQQQCLKAMGGLMKAILTGDPSSARAQLVGKAATLTGGQDPVSGFKSTFAATKDPKRTIQVDCSTGGLHACVGQYENLASNLDSRVTERKSVKEALPGQINQKISQTAQNMATCGSPQPCVGQANPNALNAISSGLQGRKEELIKAMSNMGVGEGLSLDDEEVGDAATAENGLYKPDSLRAVILGAIQPKMMKNDSKGFADARTKILDQRAKLGDYLEAVETRRAECNKLAHDAACDKATKSLEMCRKDMESDPVYLACKSARDILSNIAASAEVQQKAVDKTNSKECSTTSTTCGIKQDTFDQYCADFDSVTDSKTKDATKTGGKKKGGGDHVSGGG